MNKEIQYTQKEIQLLLLPLLKTKGKTYQKNKKIFARQGITGERISTITDDGLETKNTVLDDTSFIVQNHTDAQEQYIVKGEKFKERYDFVKNLPNGLSEYQAKGKIKAVKLTRRLWVELDFLPEQFYFEPPWGGSMVCRLYDYLVCPLDYSEVYRIARKEFWETYRKIKIGSDT